MIMVPILDLAQPPLPPFSALNDQIHKPQPTLRLIDIGRQERTERQQISGFFRTLAYSGIILSFVIKYKFTLFFAIR
jgi:hypothetical protein